MKMLKKAASIVLASAMVVSLAACGSSNDKGSSADTDTFKIGGIGPTTGDNAIYGTAVKNGIQLAVDEINAAGGINGKQIEYKFEDDQSDAEKSVNAYNTLKDWGMQMLIGTTTSTPCTAVVEESHNDNLFQLTPSATAVESIQYDNAFRMCFSDPNQGSASADYIADNNLAKKVAVIYNSSDTYSSGIYQNFVTEAEKKVKAEDTISINVSQEEDYAIIEIKDTGSGIAAAEIDKIFDRFYQTEHLNSLNTGAGTGIGLALTKGIIELHQGTIRVESEPGKGSSFIITLKLDKKHFTEEEIAQESTESTIRQTETIVPSVEIIPDSEWKEEENKRIEGAKMLIVEDNESIKQMLAGIFETFYQVSTASDGEEALEMIQKEMPSIILSDVVMPRMSGTELCKRIKTDFNTCHIPVVLLTARTAIEHNIEGLKIGADDYITKPFNTNLLISRCNNLVNSRRLLQEKFSKQPQTFAQMLATNPMDKEMLDRAMDIIERHLDDTDFNVNIFAREMGMARTNLFTKLKAVTGQTPNDFILNIRLKKGAVMLRNNPELNITEISDRIGFSSSRYFSKCFKEIYHVSPLAYRKGEEKEEGDGEETDNLYNGDNN